MGSVSASGSKSTSKPVRVGMWNPGQEALWASMWPQLQPGVTGGVPAYPKQMYIPRTPEEEAYLQEVPRLATELGAERAKMGQPAYQITPETTEEFYRTGIRAPMMQEYREITEPGIREAYAGPGYWGSARAQAQALGAEHLATTLGQARAQLAYQDELARRQALTEAAGREATYGPAAIQEQAGMLGAAGEYARGIEQERVAADLQRWLMGETVEGVTPAQYSPFYQLVFQALGLTPYALGQKSEAKSFGGGVSVMWPSGGKGGGTPT